MTSDFIPWNVAVDEINELRQRLAAAENAWKQAEQREAVLRECVELYADKNHWSTRDGVFIHPDYNCGYEPAQAALGKVEDK